ncbi:MAG: phosphoribosylanthranilate isomerase [Paludibacteraceae bacterium]|nr:phosphoribosylanthranilate isomerase [Paludibacteraceae bacterium]
MIVKVCGMRDAQNIRDIEQLGIDWMGFIFYEKSKRHVAERPSYLPTSTKRIGVFVDYTIEDVIAKVNEFQFCGVQLHGSETPDYCRQLRNALNEKIGKNVLINKAFGIASAEDFTNISSYEGCCDYYVFDTKTPTKGGAGYSFDWSLMEAYKGATPFLLSGGIGEDSYEALQAFSHPQWMGIDLNSKFEEAPAFKDVARLNSFLKKFKHHE